MKLEMEFQGMTCLDCAKNLEKALRSVPGVEDAEVSYPTKRGTVVGSEEVRREALLEVVERTGYRAEIVSSGDGAAPGGTTPLDPRQAPVREPYAGGPSEQELGDFDYDLLVVGTGGAGTAAAIRASELGANVAIVEGADVVGGTCVNVGCIPSKYLIEAAHHYHTARTAFPGIQPCEPEVVWAEVIRRKQETVETLRQEKYIDVLDSYEGITLLRGHARLLGGGRVQVGGQDVRARKIILATGTSPAMPPIPGLAEAGALTSTTAMEMEILPASLLVIGAGSIGLELGQAFARFGVKVIVVEAMERILPNEDPDVSEALKAALEAEGIEIHSSVRVTGISRQGDGYAVKIQDGSLAGEIRAEQVLVATGRKPNTDDLDLEAAGVELDARGFIAVDEFMRTSNPDIFAAGDVVGGPGYVYVAAYQGGIAAQSALVEVSGEEPIRADLSTTPAVTFTDPQVASIGMTEAGARAAGFHPKVASIPIDILPRAVVSYRRQGLIKLVADSASDRLLGAHIVAPNAGDFIGETVLAIKFGMRVQEMVSTMHPYLTWGEGLRLAGQTFTKDVAKLSCCA